MKKKQALARASGQGVVRKAQVPTPPPRPARSIDALSSPPGSVVHLDLDAEGWVDQVEDDGWVEQSLPKDPVPKGPMPKANRVRSKASRHLSRQRARRWQW